MNIHQHRGVDIVVSPAESSGWLATWRIPGEDEAIHAYRPTESQALSYAKKQIDQSFGIYPLSSVIWRKGGDWWSGIEVENGVVPSDAVPVYPESDE